MGGEPHLWRKMTGHKVARSDLGECGLSVLLATERGLALIPVNGAARSKPTAFRRALLLRKLPARCIVVAIRFSSAVQIGGGPQELE